MAVRELDGLGADAKHARGDARARILSRLDEIDAVLLTAARHELDEETALRLRREADAELAPFGARMTPDARERAVAAAFDRLVRESFALPTITFP